MAWGDGFASGLRAGTAFGSTLVSTYKAGAKDRAIGQAEDDYNAAMDQAKDMQGEERETFIRNAEEARRNAYLGSNRHANGMSSKETLEAIKTMDGTQAALNANTEARNRFATALDVGRRTDNPLFTGGQGQQQQAQVTSPQMDFRGQSMGLLNAAMNGNQEAQTLLNDAAGLYGGGNLSFDGNKVNWNIGDQSAPLDMDQYMQMGNQFFGIGSAYARFGK